MKLLKIKYRRQEKPVQKGRKDELFKDSSVDTWETYQPMNVF